MGKGDRKTRKGKRFIGSPNKKAKLNCCGITKPIVNKKMDYKQETKFAIEKEIVKLADIYDFEDTPNEKQYKDLYLFCRENLDIHFKRKSISHSYFLFSNDFSQNAKARTKNNENTVLFNMGLVNHCIEKYLQNDDLTDFIKSKHPDLAEKYNTSISDLAFQLSTQFTYYHELAHLFQFSKKETENELHERNGDDEFDIIRHKLEINADTYASICIATHIHQYILNTFSDKINQDNVVRTITIMGACLLDYILTFTDKYEIYFEENTHPHALIRLLNIILNITNHFSQIPFFKEQGITLDPVPLLRNIIDFHEKLEKNSIFKTAFSKHIKEYVKKPEKILSYFSKIKDLGNEDGYIDAMSIWNKHVKTID